MRFRLSTILLAVLSIALLTGWLTDRSIQRNSEDSIVGREEDGARAYFRSESALSDSRMFKSGAVKVRDDIESALIRAVLELCCFEKEFNSSRYSLTYDAKDQARVCLLELEVDSADSFRRLAFSLYPFMTETKQIAYRKSNNITLMESGFVDSPNEKHLPELYDTNSDEYARLDEFIARALN